MILRPFRPYDLFFIKDLRSDRAVTKDLETHFSFDNFRLDRVSRELRRKGREIKLQPQPAKLLVLLVTRRGAVVTRAEIQKALWGDDTFVDFEHGINSCIKQIRDALGECAENPRYIETVPRTGYRFMGSLQGDASEEPDHKPLLPCSHRGWKLGAGMLAALLGIGLLVWLRSKSPPTDLPMPRFQISLPRAVKIPIINFNVLALSPDGRKIAFVGCATSEPYSGCRLYLRVQSSIDARPLAGTDGAESPFFSPDGRWIAFAAKGKLRKLDLENGTVVTLADASALRGGSWGEDGTILFSRGREGILRVLAEGNVEELTKPDPGLDEHDHRWPQILPGGRAVLFEVLRNRAVGSRGHDVAILDLETGAKRILIESGGTPKYVGGHVLFGRDGVLQAASIDLERFEMMGTPVPVLEDIFMWSSPGEHTSTAGDVNYDVSREGTLLFSPREARLPRRTLVLVDRMGRREEISTVQQAYSEPHFSPDGRRIAVAVEQDVGSWGAFVLDLASDAWTKVADDAQPSAWMPDGKSLLLQGGRLAAVDGSRPEEALPISSVYASVAPDGTILFDTNPAAGHWDIWRWKGDGESSAESWLATPSWEEAPSFSPDGSWVAYFSDESGPMEIYARAFSGAGGRYQVSNQGGLFPRWSRDGGEIFFSNRRSLWSTAVRTAPTFTSEPPQELFELPAEIRVGLSQFYDVSPDGQHFVMVQQDPFELRPLDLVIIPNWIEEMKARVAAAK